MVIIIPVYNEAKHISNVLTDLSKELPKHEIIVVDDGSSDATAEEAMGHDVTVLRHRVNLGKGAALRTGARYAQKHGFDHVVFMDGDGQHTAESVEEAVGLLDDADLVVGCRSFNEDMPWFSWIGNYFFYYTAWLLFGISVRDTQSGFRALKPEVLDDVMWSTNHYGVETEMLVEAARNGVSTATFDIPTIYLDETKGTDPLHGIRIVLSMIYWRLTRWS